MSDTTPATTTDTPKPRTVVPCNFRSAGGLSNDSARHLRTVHEGFARNLSHSLDLFLGSSLEVKLVGVEQVGAREFATSLAPSSYLVPFLMASLQGRVLARFDSALLFPLLDLLLGGTGAPDEQPRELTELDEDLLRTVTELIQSQLERAWKSCHITLSIGPSIKPAFVGQVFATEERVTLIRFELTVASTVASFDVVLPMAFSNALIRASQTEATRSVARKAPGLRLRDRLLDCTMDTAADLSSLRISVGDLVGMRPGDVINLHAPVNTPVRLTMAGLDLFEITPVRHGNRKTAQLDRCIQKELSEPA